MLHTSLGYILVRTFPECIVVLMVGCYFLNFKISKKTLLEKSLMLGIVETLIRILPISFGIHTILGMICILFVLVNLSKDSFINCIIALCKLMLCLIISEGIYIKIFVDFLSVPEILLVNNYTIMGAIYSLPSLIIFVILSIILGFITKSISGRSVVKQNDEFNRKIF